MIFKDFLFLMKGTSGQNFGKIEPYLVEKRPRMGHFMYAALPQKQFKIYNFETTNTKLMKLTMIIYLY